MTTLTIEDVVRESADITDEIGCIFGHFPDPETLKVMLLQHCYEDGDDARIFSGKIIGRVDDDVLIYERHCDGWSLRCYEIEGLELINADIFEDQEESDDS